MNKRGNGHELEDGRDIWEGLEVGKWERRNVAIKI